MFLLRHASSWKVFTQCIDLYCAAKLQDTALLAKLSAEDRIATSEESEVYSDYHGISCAGLVSYIEEACMDSLVVPNWEVV